MFQYLCGKPYLTFYKANGWMCRCSGIVRWYLASASQHTWIGFCEVIYYNKYMSVWGIIWKCKLWSKVSLLLLINPFFIYNFLFPLLRPFESDLLSKQDYFPFYLNVLVCMCVNIYIYIISMLKTWCLIFLLAVHCNLFFLS